MSNLFSIEGTTYKVATKLYQMLILSLLWYVSSLFIVTIGASFTALYYVSSRIIRDEEVHLLNDYIKAFKENFMRSTAVFLCLLITAFLFRGNVYAYLSNSGLPTWMFVIQMILILEATIVGVLAFPILSRYELSPLKTLKASFLIGNRHFLVTLQGIVFIVTTLVLIYIYPALFIWLGPGMIGISNYYIFNKVLELYTTKA